MSHAKTLLSAAVLALHANFAAAQEQLLTQDISIDDTYHTREPVYVVLPTSNGELVRDFTACTSDNHLVTGNFALRADIDYARGVAKTIFGAIGVKVWIYKGEVFRKKKKNA